MITIDYIIGNTDRHLNNFGFIRNAETLQWISCAPIYDSGASLWYKNNNIQILDNKEQECKPFFTNHDLQLRLVSDFNWVNFSKFKYFTSHVENILNKGIYILGGERISLIVNSFGERLKYLESYISNIKK
jgi:hypothetical protein